MFAELVFCWLLTTTLSSGAAARDRVGLFASTAHMQIAALLPELAITVELIVFDADLLLMPALCGGAAASASVGPLLLSWAVRAAGCGVV